MSAVSIADKKRASYPVGLELEMAASLHVGCQRSNPGPLVGQPMLLLPEPSLQLPICLLCCFGFVSMVVIEY